MFDYRCVEDAICGQKHVFQVQKEHANVPREVLKWCYAEFGEPSDFVQARWDATLLRLFFRDDNDAILFRMTWCG